MRRMVEERMYSRIARLALARFRVDGYVDPGHRLEPAGRPQPAIPRPGRRLPTPTSTTHVNAERAKRNHVRQLEALGYRVTRYWLLTWHPSTGLDPAPLRYAGCCRLPANRESSD
jgi:hypothetical protein